MHINDWSNKIMTTSYWNFIPEAVGYAYAIKYKTKNIVVCVSDGAVKKVFSGNQ